MKLFTKEIDAKLFAQYSKGGDLANQMVVAKIFNPYGRGTWYLLNSDPDDPDYIWAIVDLFEPETGSVSRSELESIKVPPFRLGLERDTSFRPINAQELLNGLYQGKHYAKGGNISYTDWEEGVAESLADKLEISYNDAQGIIEANEFYMAQAWGKGLNSEEAADYIDSKTSMAQGGSIGSEYESDVQVKESEGVNYLVPPDAEEGDIVVALAKGGIIKSIEKGNEYRYLPNSSIEKDILAKVDYIVNKTKFAGNFSFKNHKNDRWIYFLDDYDRNLVKDIPLKLTERIYRSITRTAAISGISPLVKINLENGLVYYVDDDKAEMDEIVFVKKGEQTAYLNLVQVDDEDYYKLGGKTPMAKGGKIPMLKVGDKVIHAFGGKWFIGNRQNFKSGEIIGVQTNTLGNVMYEIKLTNGSIVFGDKKEVELNPDEMAKGGKIATFKEGDVVKSKDPKDGYGTITEVVGNVALVDFEDKFSNHMRRLSFSDLRKVSQSQFNNRFQSSTYMKPKRGWSHKSK
jgi:hypothetical protein